VVDFWFQLLLPFPYATSAAASTTAAAATTPPAIVIMRGGPVEPGDEPAVQRLSQLLDIA